MWTLEFNIDKKHYCDREQVTKIGGNISYGTSCYYRSLDWKRDTVDDICTYPYHKGVVRTSKRKIKFRKLKNFLYHLVNLRLGVWITTGGWGDGPIKDCQCLPNCYKLRKDKLKKLKKI